MSHRIQCADDDCDFEVEEDEADRAVDRMGEHAREEHGRSPEEETLRDRVEPA